MLIREVLRVYLSDGQPHSAVEIIRRFSEEIPPEKAAQRFYKRTRKGKDAAVEVPLDAAVVEGREIIIYELLSQWMGNGTIETSGAKKFSHRTLQWAAWHCWLCGQATRNCIERPEDGLCNDCHKMKANLGGSHADRGSDV